MFRLNDSVAIRVKLKHLVKKLARFPILSWYQRTLFSAHAGEMLLLQAPVLCLMWYKECVQTIGLCGLAALFKSGSS